MTAFYLGLIFVLLILPAASFAAGWELRQQPAEIAAENQSRKGKCSESSLQS